MPTVAFHHTWVGDTSGFVHGFIAAGGRSTFYSRRPIAARPPAGFSFARGPRIAPYGRITVYAFAIDKFASVGDFA